MVKRRLAYLTLIAVVLVATTAPAAWARDDLLDPLTPDGPTVLWYTFLMVSVVVSPAFNLVDIQESDAHMWKGGWGVLAGTFAIAEGIRSADQNGWNGFQKYMVVAGPISAIVGGFALRSAVNKQKNTIPRAKIEPHVGFDRGGPTLGLSLGVGF